MDLNFQNHGVQIVSPAFERWALEQVASDLLAIGAAVQAEGPFKDLDAMWNHHRRVDRLRAGSIYNGFKRLPSVMQLAGSHQMMDHLKKICGLKQPACVDINCRIDSAGEEQYLFDWHQDYWFSVCSPRSVVAWIPITGLSPDRGGLELITNDQTVGRIFRTKEGNGAYNSYADAVRLDESVADFKRHRIDCLEIGDALLFSFNTLHKSLPVLSSSRSRFTVQIRFSDFTDEEFKAHQFKPGVVNRSRVDYLAGSPS